MGFKALGKRLEGGQMRHGLGPNRSTIRVSQTLLLFLTKSGGGRTELSFPATTLGASETSLPKQGVREMRFGLLKMILPWFDASTAPVSRQSSHPLRNKEVLILTSRKAEVRDNPRES